VALPAQDMAEVGRVAYVKDPDGNLFGLFQANAPEEGQA
jgi:predicted enzyme related to lactoylglutathione lyase